MNESKRASAIPRLMVLLVSLFWGLGSPVVKIGGALMPPFAQIATRCSLAFLLFLIFQGRHIFRNLRKTLTWPCFFVSLCMALALTMGSLALMLSRATTAGFLMGLAVLITPVLERLLLGRPINRTMLPVALVVCVGMYLLCAGDGTFTFGLGEMCAVLCSLFFAMALSLTEKTIQSVDPIALAAMQCFVGSLMGLVLTVLFENAPPLAALDLKTILSLVYLGAFGTFAACLLQNKAIRHIPATFASVAFCMEPVFTAIFAYPLLGETLTLRGLLGAAIILFGLIAASLADSKRERKAQNTAEIAEADASARLSSVPAPPVD